MIKRVCFIYPPLFKYRIPFYNEARRLLAQHDIEFFVIYCDPLPELHDRDDIGEWPWAVKTKVWYFSRFLSKVTCKGLALQRAFSQLKGVDLIIMQQENRLLINYYIHVLKWLGVAKIAYFGHGRNFQATNPNSLSERFKRIISKKVNWWFAYNSLSADLIESYGFPSNKITSFENAIDTSTQRKAVARITPEEIEAKLAELGIRGHHVAIYIGSLYREKRIGFLIEVAKRIRAEVADFELIVVGGGDEETLVEEASSTHDYIHYVGPKHGDEKHVLAMMSSVFLIPGAVGLAALDAFVYGLPLVTTRDACHGPEIAYLKSGRNSIIVEDGDSVESYVAEVVRLFKDEEYGEKLAAAAREDAKHYTIENMAQKFVGGVVAALAISK